MINPDKLRERLSRQMNLELRAKPESHKRTAAKNRASAVLKSIKAPVLGWERK